MHLHTFCMPLSKSVGRRPVRVMSCALSCACSSSRCGAYVVQVDGLHAMARVCSRSRPVFRSVRFVTKEQRYGREVQSAAVAEEHNKSQDHHWRKPRVSMEAGSVRAREDRWCDFFFFLRNRWCELCRRGRHPTLFGDACIKSSLVDLTRLRTKCSAGTEEEPSSRRYVV